MSQQNDLTVASLQKLADVSIKLAQAAKERTDKVKTAAASPAVSTEVVEKAAAALVDNGWVGAERKAETVAYLSAPDQALTALTNLAEKSASVIARLSGSDATGTPVANKPETTKKASDESMSSPADKAFQEKMLRYRTGRA